MKNLLRGAFPNNSTIRTDTLRAAAQRSRLYIIFLTPRSGSTWLTELATNSGTLGAPQEWFNQGWIYTDELALGCRPPIVRGISDVNLYIDDIVDEGNGVAGLELSVHQAIMVRQLLDGPFDPNWLTATFYIRRRDLIGQAISLYRSVGSGLFHSYQDKAEQLKSFASMEYDHDKAIDWLRHIIDSERRFDEELFKSCELSPIPLFYEDLQADPLTVLQMIAQAVGSPALTHLPKTTLRVLRDSKSLDWRERLSNNLPNDIRGAIAARDVALAESG